MTTPIASITAAKPVEKSDTDTAKIGQQFEAILVRQMLSAAQVGGKGGYADMGVEALATSITSNGGLGLGRAITQSLDAHASHPLAPAAEDEKK